MDEQLKLFRDLVLGIWDNHEKPWEYSHATARDIYGDLENIYRSLGNRNEIETFLPTEERVKGDFPNNRFLYLNPVTHGPVLVPVLNVGCDFGRSIPKIGMRLGLFQRHNGDIKGIGYRYEGPEGPGIHNYYHMQMIKGFTTSTMFEPHLCLEWVPDSEPTLPLDANGTVKLLLCLLVSLYGIEAVVNLLMNIGTGRQLDDYLKEMHCCSTPTLEWYWRVAIGNPPKREEYYSTEKKPQDFIEYFSKKYTKCIITGMTKGAYDKQPNKKVYPERR